MTSRFISLKLPTQTKIKLVALLVALSVPSMWPCAQTSTRAARPAQASGCSGTFAGDWTAPQLHDGRLGLSVQGESVSGQYSAGKSQRLLKGRIDGDHLYGDWADQGQRKQVGTFVAQLSPDRKHLNVRFYERKIEIENTEWSCSQAANQPTPVSQPQTLPQPPRVGPTPPPGLSDNHDNDQFRTFDALPKAQQEKSLTKRGPRLPQQYNVSNFASRVFVAGGWPVVLDYGLDSDAVALLSISVEGFKALLVRIRPAQRDQVHIVIPDHFGPTPQVAKLTISALTRSGDPAYFHLYGIAMGQRGVQALNKLNASGFEVQLAMNSPISATMVVAEPLPLFLSNFPQEGSTIQITVNPPTTITTGMKPKQLIGFSFRSQSVFSNGRWELWHVSGFDWLEVWQKKTGSITPNQPKSEKWDGIKSFRKIVSQGDHALQVTLWHGREADRAWVVARAEPTLIVTQ